MVVARIRVDIGFGVQGLGFQVLGSGFGFMACAIAIFLSLFAALLASGFRPAFLDTFAPYCKYEEPLLTGRHIGTSHHDEY